MTGSFDSLSSFDQINLGSTFLQAVVAVSFAAVQHGVARHFDRPAMRALDRLWRLIALAAVVNIFSSWSGAVWDNKELSRALNTIVIALLAAGIPYVRRATTALMYPDRLITPGRHEALGWAAATLIVHAVGVFGFGALGPDLRILAVTWSRVLKLVVLAIPAQIAWRAYTVAPQHKRALRLLALGFSALAIRQAISVVLGLRVGMPDLPFSAVIAAITIEVVAIMMFGVMSLLTNTAEELAVVQRQTAALVAAKARIESGERMQSLGRLAAGVAHDFNNVLQVIRLASGSLRQSVTGRDDAIVLDEINSASSHGAALVSQLLTFARQQPQDPKRFDALDRLRSLTPMLLRVAGPSAECDVTVAAGSAMVEMDPSQFEQIAINLVSNARDAVCTSGRIDVALTVHASAPGVADQSGREQRDCVCLTVTDNGKGIPEEIRARIFEPFFTTKEVGTGSGLGLALVHGIAERAGGSVAVESFPGVRTVFTVTLPVVEIVRPRGDAAAPNSPTPPVRLASVG